MRRSVSRLPITPAMLKHFAVFTAVATGCLAMFATGENSSAEQAIRGVHDAAASQSHGPLPGQSVNGKIMVREVGGLKLAPGTRLGQDLGGGSSENTGSSGQGDIRNAGLAVAGGPDMAGPVAAAQPVVMVRDAAGVPAPSVTAATTLLPNGQPKPPRRASQQDYQRMMAESLRRSGLGNEARGE